MKQSIFLFFLLSADDVGVTNIVFKCDNGNQLGEWNYGEAGTWGRLPSGIKECPRNQRVCGMRAEINRIEHSVAQDAVGLNDVTLYCCNYVLL